MSYKCHLTVKMQCCRRETKEMTVRFLASVNLVVGVFARLEISVGITDILQLHSCSDIMPSTYIHTYILVLIVHISDIYLSTCISKHHKKYCGILRSSKHQWIVR